MNPHVRSFVMIGPMLLAIYAQGLLINALGRFAGRKDAVVFATHAKVKIRL